MRTTRHCLDFLEELRYTSFAGLRTDSDIEVCESGSFPRLLRKGEGRAGEGNEFAEGSSALRE